ncbi:MAG: adenylate/guanylate cyclase domain-containing protein [Aeromicrobium sp.]
MTLVERFIDFSDWPPARKSALFGAVVTPGLVSILLFMLFARPRAIDVPMLVRLDLVGVGIGSVGGLISWVMSRNGREGGLTAYVFFLTYQLWAVVLVLALGGYTSPFVWLPVILPLLTALWYDVRMGVVSAVYISVLMLAGSELTVRNFVPFAPAMRIRSIDTLNTDGWLAVTLFALLFSAVWVYLVGFVAVAAAELQHRRLRVAHGLIRRYVPEQVAEAVLSDTPESIERHERRKLTIFFSDLVGFTDLSEELEPEDLAMVLHDYFTEMSAIARHHGGTVDDLVGDAILVFYGAPERTDDHDQALRAVRMAVEMQAAMGPLNQKWEAAGIPETLRVRMGINTGIATVGNFGSQERTKYTALGKQVNIAARIQSQCEPGKVLLSHPTWLLVRDEISCTPKGELTLKGLHKPMVAYEVQT